MDKNDKKLLQEKIIDIKNQNQEELWLITKKCLSVYFNSLISYGPIHNITKSVYGIWKEFYSILIKEKYIIYFLRKNYMKIELSEVNLFLDELDKLNEQTYLYYNKILFGIKDACELKKECFSVRPKKEFNTLIETDNYELETYGLTIDLDNIKDFFNYPEQFWNYVKGKILIVPKEHNDFMEPQVIIKLDNLSKLIDIKIIVPEIINLKTALINVHEFQHAYDLYLLLGKIIPYEDEYYESVAKQKENDFKEYVLKI